LAQRYNELGRGGESTEIYGWFKAVKGIDYGESFFLGSKS